jgi:hypothetical protein
MAALAHGPTKPPTVPPAGGVCFGAPTRMPPSPKPAAVPNRLAEVPPAGSVRRSNIHHAEPSKVKTVAEPRWAMPSAARSGDPITNVAPVGSRATEPPKFSPAAWPGGTRFRADQVEPERRQKVAEPQSVPVPARSARVASRR